MKRYQYSMDKKKEKPFRILDPNAGSIGAVGRDIVAGEIEGSFRGNRDTFGISGTRILAYATTGAAGVLDFDFILDEVQAGCTHGAFVDPDGAILAVGA